MSVSRTYILILERDSELHTEQTKYLSHTRSSEISDLKTYLF